MSRPSRFSNGVNPEDSIAANWYFWGMWLIVVLSCLVGMKLISVVLVPTLLLTIVTLCMALLLCYMVSMWWELSGAAVFAGLAVAVVVFRKYVHFATFLAAYSVLLALVSVVWREGNIKRRDKRRRNPSFKEIDLGPKRYPIKRLLKRRCMRFLIRIRSQPRRK